MFLNAIMEKHQKEALSVTQRTVLPSSTLFFELIEEGDKLLIEAFFNDQPVHLKGCLSIKGCGASEFAASLSAGIAYTDVAKACQESTTSSK